MHAWRGRAGLASSSPVCDSPLQVQSPVIGEHTNEVGRVTRAIHTGGLYVPVGIGPLCMQTGPQWTDCSQERHPDSLEVARGGGGGLGRQDSKSFIGIAGRRDVMPEAGSPYSVYWET